MARPFFFGSPSNDSVEAKLKFIMDALREIERRSQEDPIDIFDSYTVTDIDDVTETRELDVTTPTPDDENIRQVLATLIGDFKRRGVNRREPT